MVREKDLSSLLAKSPEIPRPNLIQEQQYWEMHYSLPNLQPSTSEKGHIS